jgi:hypothetical protein
MIQTSAVPVGSRAKEGASYVVGVGERPTCACGNLVERRDERSYKTECSSCRKGRAGRKKPNLPTWREVQSRGVCEACGLKQVFAGFLQTHHLDGRPSNNVVENLALLCPNCHSIADYDLARRRVF